mmetsp:Transcript_32824/g.61242  ORF Transcript_32824/g.61242 Transcript_32824/m.61242 type:complete len:297 (-) Transcript_32824:1196-2086(-)
MASFHDVSWNVVSPDLPMDVLLYTLDFQWPLTDDLHRDLDEIARRSCVSKQFNHTMKKIKSLRIQYYLQQFPLFKVLSIDVLQFAEEVINRHTNWGKNDTRTRAFQNKPMLSFRVLETQMTDFAIQWRFNIAMTSFSEQLPKAMFTLSCMIFELCMTPDSHVLAVTAGDFRHENLAMWLIFVCNVSSAMTVLEDGAYDEISSLLTLLYEECDHVHNGFRKLGDINATETTRRGYYYRGMQASYISTQQALIQQKQSQNITGVMTIAPLVSELAHTFIARYRCVWSYQEDYRLKSIT